MVQELLPYLPAVATSNAAALCVIAMVAGALLWVCGDIWERMPGTVRRIYPYAAGTAMISALSLALLFPRLGRLMCFSATGVTIAFLAALTLMASRRPDWLDSIPPRPDAQAGALALLT